MARRPQNSFQIGQPAYLIALEEARALRNHAQALHASVTAAAPTVDSTTLGAMLAALAMIGLSIELYMKAFMAAARGGVVTPGHDLALLYAEFPSYLRAALEERYSQLRPQGKWYIPVLALKMSRTQPQSPDDHMTPGARYDDFETAIRGLADAFVRARYFYERVEDEWSSFDYAVEPGLYLTQALDTVLEDWRNGVFRGMSS